MAKRKPKGLKPHKFRNKILLNQWLVSLFGIDPLQEHNLNGKIVRPFHVLADPVKNLRAEGLDHDNLHHFYHGLINSTLFWDFTCRVSKEQILTYEEKAIPHWVI